jgi:hypothetical protein
MRNISLLGVIGAYGQLFAAGNAEYHSDAHPGADRD